MNTTYITIRRCEVCGHVRGSLWPADRAEACREQRRTRGHVNSCTGWYQPVPNQQAAMAAYKLGGWQAVLDMVNGTER
jgi:hypothetical protein